ncbi:two-component regulator propeller domain-containing protein [Flavobacterium tegetincola]|uniref:type IX secretion system anionic LPS delivery protein PorZ n=1 Tax=Flavobacterium tegetincola TaxID=150172 RepID=UPI000419DAA8|nr:two-component regulator propeller domain-containing protein [Flavobacterium tegetincola]
MKYFFVALVSMLLIQTGFAQKNQSWKGYFSYNDIKDIAQSPTQFFAASENALFSRSTTTDEIKTTNTVDGLSGQTISSIYHSPTFNRTLIGYENGLLIVVNEADGSIKKVVDIINKQLPPNIKKINHFTEFEGIAYLSCDFGIVQFNLATLLFGDTYFIGNNGAEIAVNQTTVFNGFIYASCSFNGIRRANITSANLINFSEWTEINSGGWNGIAQVGAELVAINTSGNLQRFNGASFQPFLQFAQPAVDLRATENQLAITFSNQVRFFNATLGPILTVNDTQLNQLILPKFTCAAIIGTTAYIGTTENGVITASTSGPVNFNYLLPDGPIRNSTFAINASTENLWVVFGGHDSDYNPYNYDNFGGPALYGISKLVDKKWLNIPPTEVLGAKALSHISINPNNKNEVFISSMFSGLLKLENDEASMLFTATNTAPNGLEFEQVEGNPNDIRINNAVFDKSGNLWLTNNKVVKGLKVLKTNGQWQSFSLESILPKLPDFGSLVIDKNNTKWMASRDGVFAFNENGNTLKVITEGSENGNLPSREIRTLAIDNRNQLWIGTNKGLRVLSSVDRFNAEGQMTANPIIILEEDVAQELLFEQFITNIVVDGANNKWVGTANSGVFQFSSDGQQTLQRFTVDNSPLPSNTIYDIDINPITGEVFFATPQGIVVYKGISTDGSGDLNNVIVYPNPVRPGFAGTVKITGLLDKANVKITDISGNLVHEVISEGGTIEWNTTAFGKYKVASGVYMIFIAAPDGVETAVRKVMIIR